MKYRSIHLDRIVGFLLSVALVASHVQATTIMDTNWVEKNAPAADLQAHDFTLLGDSINLSTGGIQFDQVDVSLPGNSRLPVEIRRHLDPSRAISGDFGDWKLAIPTISTKILTDEWFANTRWGKIRCSNSLVSAIPNATWPTHNGGGPITPPYYSDGVILNVPGRTNTPLLDKTVSAGWPAAASKVTADNWYLTCLSNIDGAGTEGFVAVAPNGDRYTFNVIMNTGTRESEFDIWEMTTPSQGSSGTGSPFFVYTKMGVYYDVLAVSAVTDVNGNWVHYQYDANNKLIGISSNDGRQITITRSPGGASIASVTANGRTWTYTLATKIVVGYGAPGNANGPGTTRQDNRIVLSDVALPDGRHWQYDLANLQAPGVPGIQYSTTVCKQFDKSVSVTHPDGVTGVFQLKEVTLRIGQATAMASGAFCPNTNLGDSGTTQLSDVMAVTSKTLSGPGMPTSVWSYSYANGSSEIVTTVIQPDNTKKVVHHPQPYSYIAPNPNAQLSKEELFATPTDTTPVQVTDYTYLVESAAGSNYVYFPPNETFSPYHSVDTILMIGGSDTYKTHNTYDGTRSSSTYSYGYPTQIDTLSNVRGGTRTSVITYSNDLANWVLGLKNTITKNGKLFDDFNYDTTRPWQIVSQDHLGVRVGTYNYFQTGDQSGLINVYRDGLSRPTTFSGWKRGIPGTVTRADSTTLVRGIDDNGWITSIKDWNGTVTGYGYNPIGRLSLIDRPAPWSDTNIGYSYSSGSLVQTATRGTEKDSTTYDGLLRPTQKLRQALSGGGGPVYTSTKYDAAGRVIFTSLPASVPGSLIGLSTEYDALGRVKKKQETASGGSTHNYTYPAGNKSIDTDQNLFVTTTFFSGYASPNDGKTQLILAPEGTSTTFAYDIYGNPTDMYQTRSDGSNVVTTWYYDSQLRVCRKHVTETGDVLYAYNAADELTSYAEGQPTGGSCATPPAGQSVVLTYDLVGRPTTTDYPNSTPDIIRTYDNNNNPLTVNRGGANWTYTYNTADLIATERLSIDALNYKITNVYDADERLTQKTYPSGNIFTFANDGLGEVKTVQSNGNTYVSNISWYPNGKIQQLTQGNGNVFDQQLNDRQLPSRIGSTYGDDFNYTYDADGRIATIDSVANNAYDRTLTYDGIGRLKTASGPWGSGSFVYDAIGNITKKTLGSRVVDLTYDTRNRVSQVRDSAVSSSWRTYSYDSRGNVTGDGIRTFTNDDSNQPTSITGTGSGSYTYDGNLHRVKTVAGGATTYSFYDLGGNLLGRNNRTTSKKTDYISVGGQTFVRVTNGVATYPINDHLGTALWVAAQNGSVSASQTFNYDPSGQAVSGSGSGHLDEQGFARHIEDASNLTYMQARYYDPVIGRFLEADPLGYKDQLNLYAYVGNDPINRTDPFGKYECVSNGNGTSTCTANGVLDTIAMYVIVTINNIIVSSQGSSDTPSDTPTTNDKPAETPSGVTNVAPLPTGLVGEQDKDAGEAGNRHNSGPLAPEFGGQGDANADFGTLTGGNSAPAPEGSTLPAGSQVGTNGVILRPATDSSGPRIDVPANGDKPHETLHYP